MPTTRHRTLGRAALAALTLAAVFTAGRCTSAAQVGHFRTPQDARDHHAAYTAAMRELPPPTRTLDLPVDIGTVRAYAFTSPHTADATPVVLLPGRGAGAPMWAANLPGLLLERPVYALDAPGDAGASTQNTPLTDHADQADWVDQALAAADIPRAHVVGHSFGGAIAAALATRHPDRVATLTLLDPVFVLDRPPLTMLGWATLATLPAPQAWRDHALARVGGTDTDDVRSDDPLARLIDIGTRGYSSHQPIPTVLTDDELRSLRMPTYVALADQSSLAGDGALERAALLPDGSAHRWPGTTHSLPMQVPDALTATLAAFWARSERR